MVGADIWKLLSLGLEERVTKKTFRAILERKERLSLHSTDSQFYAEPPSIERLCCETIEQSGALIDIQAPRQTGKTSLMARILQHATLQGYQTIALNLRLVDRNICQSSEQFLQWFCLNLCQELQLPHQLNHYWDDLLGSKMSCHNYFKNYLLQQIEHPIVIALDEVDWLFQYPEIAEDMFAVLHAWHEAAKTQPKWAKLRLVLVRCSDQCVSYQFEQSYSRSW